MTELEKYEGKVCLDSLRPCLHVEWPGLPNCSLVVALLNKASTYTSIQDAGYTGYRMLYWRQCNAAYPLMEGQAPCQGCADTGIEDPLVMSGNFNFVVGDLIVAMTAYFYSKFKQKSDYHCLWYEIFLLSEYTKIL